MCIFHFIYVIACFISQTDAFSRFNINNKNSFHKILYKLICLFNSLTCTKKLIYIRYQKNALFFIKIVTGYKIIFIV